jgi:dTDP-4-amino-4,6-dideoxygalactose transaminase
MDDKIYVTQPYLPPLQEFLPYLERIWEAKWLTNNGQFHREFEAVLRERLGVPQVSLFNNGTIALVTALRALGISGEVITTPYSFVATAHSLLWNNIRPVFVDIDPQTMNLDPRRIEAALSRDTRAILPVHCYGLPCDVAGIRRVADAHGLKVVYDAAHAFGVTLGGASLVAHGDLAVLSFHATKVFNTFEGGAVVSHDAATKRHIDQLKNFGIMGEVTVEAIGINGKMNEVQAAFGLLQLQHVGRALERRKAVDARYREALGDVRGLTLVAVPKSGHNYSHFPVLVGPGYPVSRDALYEALRAAGIFARRYFYPLISEMPMYRELPSSAPANLPVATRIAREILCLPLHPDLAPADVDRVIAIVRGDRSVSRS